MSPRSRALRPLWLALWVAAVSACTASNPAFSSAGDAAGTGGALASAAGGSAAANSGGGGGGRPGQAGQAGQAGLPADAAKPGTVDLITGLIGYWRMDEAAGATVARDSSTLHNDGKLEVADPATSWIPGKFGSALQFNDNDKNYGVRVEATARIDGLTRYTVAAWVRRLRVRPGAYMSIISRQLGTGIGEVFDMSVSNDLLQAYAPDRSNDGVSAAAAKATAPVNQWFHAAATYDGNTLRVYQDGIEQGSVTWTKGLPSTTTPLYLGTNKNSAGASDVHHPWEGLIDELLLYDVALSPASIAALASGTRPPAP